VIVEALVEVREGIHKLGWAGDQAEGKVHRGGANGDGGGQGCSLARARKRPWGFL
jgi:hypothetical protein